MLNFKEFLNKKGISSVDETKKSSEILPFSDFINKHNVSEKETKLPEWQTIQPKQEDVKLPEWQTISPKETKLPKLDWWDKVIDVKDRPGQLVPFVAGAEDTLKFANILVAANKLKDGDPTVEDLELLQEYVDMSSRDTTFAYKVLDVISYAPSFAGELYLTSGFGTGARAVTVKTAKEVLENLLTKGGKELLESQMVKQGIAITGGIVARSVQAPLAGATRIMAGTLEKQLQGTLGEIYGGEEKEDLIVSFGKSLGEQWVETLSEFSGGVFKNLTKPAQDKFLKLGLFSAFQKANPLAGADDLMKIVNELGYHGVIEEMMEERAADVGHGVLFELGLGDQEFSLRT